jgi:hypothetical protein
MDLRAAYCTALVQHYIANVQEVITSFEAMEKAPTVPSENVEKAKENFAKTLVDLKSALDRLQGYLLPRLSSVDPDPLRAAAAHANADETDYSKFDNSCTQKCIREHAPTLTCYKECMPGELASRIESCRNPSWLPL